jgi:hypothetical protein
MQCDYDASVHFPADDIVIIEQETKMNLGYEIWDNQQKRYVFTRMFQCLGVNKSGDRCRKFVSGRLFCALHCMQEKQLDLECLKFFGIKAKARLW